MAGFIAAAIVGAVALLGTSLLPPYAQVSNGLDGTIIETAPPVESPPPEVPEPPAAPAPVPGEGTVPGPGPVPCPGPGGPGWTPPGQGGTPPGHC
jgi:hypothetical protein